MREIKFRAWSVKEHKMIDWLVFAQTAFNTKDWGDYAMMHHLFTSPHLIPMQYTGLKDKNGKEIFEGDIVRKDYGGINKERLSHVKGVVEYGTRLVNKDTWDVEHFCTGWFIEFEDKSGFIPVTDEFTVIGNIYENADMLQPKAELV